MGKFWETQRQPRNPTGPCSYIDLLCGFSLLSYSQKCLYRSKFFLLFGDNFYKLKLLYRVAAFKVCKVAIATRLVKNQICRLADATRSADRWVCRLADGLQASWLARYRSPYLENFVVSGFIAPQDTNYFFLNTRPARYKGFDKQFLLPLRVASIIGAAMLNSRLFVLLNSTSLASVSV